MHVRQESLTAEISTISFPITTAYKQQRTWEEMAQPRPLAMHPDRQVADIPAHALQMKTTSERGDCIFHRIGRARIKSCRRISESSSRAALIHQRVTSDRDRAIADRLGAMTRDGGGGPSDSNNKDVTRTQWHGTGNGQGPALEETPPEPALLAVHLAGFEPATPALGVRSGSAPAAAVDWCDSRTEMLVYALRPASLMPAVDVRSLLTRSSTRIGL
ncbi:hypothetical protein GCM10010317_042990 [Streptomyces mirabilis]|nr:hypothetical protein GCM10010317_042990 [Streptomyces mirabilis]